MSFQFQLVVTEKCNLNCSYCYMKKNSINMSNETFDKHYKSLPILMSKYNQSDYVTSFFGGEPLLNFELIKYAVNILKNDPKCKGMTVVTNGLPLGPDKKNFLNENGVNISISFDGLWNDVNRKLINGGDSVKYYINNKNFLRLKSCKVMVGPKRGTVSMVDNYRWFMNEFDILSPDYTLVRDDIWSDEDVELFSKELTELTDENIKVLLSGKESIIGWYELYFLDTYIYKKYGKRKFGCFAGNHGLSFMPDGFVYPCARFGSKKEYLVYDSILNHFYEPDRLEIISDKISNPQEYKECKECSLYNICNAGCLYSQLDYSKKVDGEIRCRPIPNVCKLLKLLYSETLRLVNTVGETKAFKKVVEKSIKRIG